jgi:hypothetical protein
VEFDSVGVVWSIHKLTSTIFYNVSSIVDQNLGTRNGFVLGLFATFARTPKSTFRSQL